jgi:hypothetical protein
MDQWKRTAELWMKKRFVSAILFVELEIVSKSTISITLRVIYKSCPSSTGPLALMHDNEYKQRKEEKREREEFLFFS